MAWFEINHVCRTMQKSLRFTGRTMKILLLHKHSLIHCALDMIMTYSKMRTCSVITARNSAIILFHSWAVSRQNGLSKKMMV
jgi:hypothetical protein